MGQVPPKYMMPSAPYGQSDAVNAVNAVQPAAINPQTPLLPPNFTDPGTQASQTSSTPLTSSSSGSLGQASKNPFAMNPMKLGGAPQLYRNLFGQ